MILTHFKHFFSPFIGNLSLSVCVMAANPFPMTLTLTPLEIRLTLECDRWNPSGVFPFIFLVCEIPFQESSKGVPFLIIGQDVANVKIVTRRVKIIFGFMLLDVVALIDVKFVVN